MMAKGAKLAPVRRKKEYKLKAFPLWPPAQLPMKVIMVGISKEIADTNVMDDRRLMMRPEKKKSGRTLMLPSRSPRNKVFISPSCFIKWLVSKDNPAPSKPAERMASNSLELPG